MFPLIPLISYGMNLLEEIVLPVSVRHELVGNLGKSLREYDVSIGALELGSQGVESPQRYYIFSYKIWLLLRRD